MLDLPRVTDLAGDVARAMLAGRHVESISVEPSTGAFGDDLLRVTVVVQGAEPDWPNGESILAFQSALRDRLEQLGDERLPLVDILTPADLSADVDPES